MFWLRGRHPKEPSSWRADVRDAEERVAAWARGELKLAEGEDVFEERWGEQKVKVAFSGQQHLKCAYCEMSIASDPNGGDMDHLRPKAVITRLLDDPATWGEEIADHNSRDPKKRRQAPEVCRGYWWLAYAWRNHRHAPTASRGSGCARCTRSSSRARRLRRAVLPPLDARKISRKDRKGPQSTRPALCGPSRSLREILAYRRGRARGVRTGPGRWLRGRRNRAGGRCAARRSPRSDRARRRSRCCRACTGPTPWRRASTRRPT
jgi:hypothetical protein